MSTMSLTILDLFSNLIYTIHLFCLWASLWLLLM